jgi:hypothetical protein
MMNKLIVRITAAALAALLLMGSTAYAEPSDDRIKESLALAGSTAAAFDCEEDHWETIRGNPEASNHRRSGTSRTKGGTGEVAFWIEWLGYGNAATVSWVKAKVNDIYRDGRSAVAQIRYRIDPNAAFYCYRTPAIDSGANGVPVTSRWYRSTTTIMDVHVRACLADRRAGGRAPAIIESTCDQWR